jgi:hypothetical protein
MNHSCSKAIKGKGVPWASFSTCQQRRPPTTPGGRMSSMERKHRGELLPPLHLPWKGGRRLAGLGRERR